MLSGACASTLIGKAGSSVIRNSLELRIGSEEGKAITDNMTSSFFLSLDFHFLGFKGRGG
jgi:hypothetical protein